MEKLPYIYRKQILSTGKYYVGKHNGNKKSYLGSGTDYLEDVKKFVKNRKKDIFTEILEYVEDISKLNERETYWLQYFNVADDPLYYNRSNISHGCHITKDKTKKLQSVSSPFRKKILQYSLDGTFIKEWECMADVSREYLISTGDLTRTCQNKQKSAGGFQWKYYEPDYPLNILPYIKYTPTESHKQILIKRLTGITKTKEQKKHRFKPIIQYDINGNFIKEFEYIREVFSELNIKEGTLNACLNKVNGQKTAGGFQWAYKTTPNYPMSIPPVKPYEMTDEQKTKISKAKKGKKYKKRKINGL
jgi:hypothetical protein